MRRCLLFLCVTAPLSIANAGDFKVLSTVGDVQLERNEQALPAQPRLPLLPSDKLQTLSNGSACLLAGEAVVYLDASTSVRRSPDGEALWLDQGRIRVTNGLTQPLLLVTPEAAATLGRGIFQISIHAQGTRIQSEAGVATATRVSRGIALAAHPGSQHDHQVADGQQVFVPAEGQANNCPVPPADACDEPMEVDELQEEAADAADEDQAEDQPDATEQEDSTRAPGQTRRRPPSSTQNQNAGVSSFTSFGGLSAGGGFGASGGLFADAAQSTNQGQVDSFPADGVADGGPFPGNIHLVTGESRYGFAGVQLNQAERDAIFTNGDPSYFSIGFGALPAGQVTTDFVTASNAPPHAVRIPGTNHYVVRLDQYGITDPALDPAGGLANNVGITGLIGADPSSPVVNGATPLLDERAKLNDGATFALGEFRLSPNGGTDGQSFEIAVRRSDQDRLIVKDGGGNDANDLVTPNPDVAAFVDVVDPRFLPAAPTVKVPVGYTNAGTQFSQLNDLRRAAATTVIADQLQDFARRTGQTRFVVDGRIIDISGFQQ